MSDPMCGDGPDARYCDVFWSKSAECEALRAERDRYRKVLGEAADRYLADDLDDAGATIIDYRDALCAMQAERDELSEHLAVIRERIGQLATRLELSAAATEPSRKSDIERQTARRVREIASQDANAAALTDIREAIADEMRANEPAELVTARSQVDYFRELVAEILAVCSGERPAPANSIANWRQRAGLPGITGAGTEHVARQLLDERDPHGPAWQRVADMPAEGR